jgi:hypothetical protein
MSNSIGDLKNSGLQGNNWPWQYKVLLGLDKITSLLGAGTEYEAQLVTETCTGPPATSRILLEVRVWNTDTGTWGPTTYYLPGSSTPVTIAPGCTVAYVDSSAILAQILNVLQDIENGVPEALGQTTMANSMPVVIASNQSSLPVTIDCNDRISLCVGGIIVDATNPLPTTASVTFPTGSITACDDAVAITFCATLLTEFLAQGTALDAIQNAVGGTLTVDGTVNIGTLPAITGTVTATIACADSSIKICDADGDTLDVNADGSINLGALDATTGTFASLTYTGTGLANALDVNIIGGTVTATIDCDTSSIAICDGTPGGSNLVINNLGGPADGSINTVLVDLTTGAPAVINPDGTQNNAVYGYDHSTMQNEQITSTDISPTVQALDVNVAPSVTNVLLDSLVETTDGDLSLFGNNITSITFQSIGTAAAKVSVNGGSTFFDLAPGTVINLAPGVTSGFYQGTLFFWDLTTNPGSSLLIIYNYI